MSRPNENQTAAVSEETGTPNRAREAHLVRQTGEHLVCAELGRQGLLATPFAGNVPVYDVVAVDDSLNTVAIQVKAAQSAAETAFAWPAKLGRFLRVDFDPVTGVQTVVGRTALINPDLIYCFVLLRGKHNERDRFFLCSEQELQGIIHQQYASWLQSQGGRRPRRPDSKDCRVRVGDLKPWENNWATVFDRLASIIVKPSALAEPAHDSVI